MCLKSILVVFLFLQNCFAEVKPVRSEEDFNRFVIETSIRGWCREKWDVADFSKRDFNYYKSSIFNVIAEAFADCILGHNEFAQEPLTEEKDIKIIEFKDTNVEGYVRSNWNAVILYNYLSLVINGYGLPLYDIRHNPVISGIKGIEYVAQKVKGHYENTMENKVLFNNFIKQAVDDIHFYFKNLRLYEYLRDLINERFNLSIWQNGRELYFYAT